MERTEQLMNTRTGRHTTAAWVVAALLGGTVAMTAASSIGAQQVDAPAASGQATHAKPAAAKHTHDESDGERVFAANCSRCHTAPDGFSPHITGTVVRHMRVRASLSEQDEKALLRFFNSQ
jgi:cytochrome c5